MTKPKTPTTPYDELLLAEAAAKSWLSTTHDLGDLLNIFPEQDRLEAYKLTLEYLSKMR